MNQSGIDSDYRKCTAVAHKLESKTEQPCAAIELNNGEIITGKTTDLLGCSSAMLLNALKKLAGIKDDVLLISPDVIKPIQALKVNHLKSKNPRLHTDEVLIALSMSAINDKNAALALDQIPKLENTEMHSTVMLSEVDKNIIGKLGIRLSCDPKRR